MAKITLTEEQRKEMLKLFPVADELQTLMLDFLEKHNGVNKVSGTIIELALMMLFSNVSLDSAEYEKNTRSFLDGFIVISDNFGKK